MLRRYGGFIIVGIFLVFMSGLIMCGAHALSQLEKSFTIEGQIVLL